MTMKPLLLPCFLLAGLTVPALAQVDPTARRPALLFHGNYCGPGNNAPLPPVDALDLACAHHDACTPRGDLASPACNARLQREAEAVSRDPRQPEHVRTMAGFVAAGAALLPSDPRARSAPPVIATGPGGYAPTVRRPAPGPIVGLDPDDED